MVLSSRHEMKMVNSTRLKMMKREKDQLRKRERRKNFTSYMEAHHLQQQRGKSCKTATQTDDAEAITST
jgi:hypothetical protein